MVTPGKSDTVKRKVNEADLIAEIQQADNQHRKEVFELFLQEHRNSTDHFAVGNSLKGLGLIALQEDNYELGIKYLKDSLARFKKSKNSEQSLNVLIHLGTASQIVGDRPSAEKYYREILKSYRKYVDNDILARSLMFVSLCELSRGDIIQAKRHFDESIEIMKMVDDKDSLAQNLMIFGEMCFLFDLSEEGVGYLEWSLSLYEELNHFEGIYTTHYSLGSNAQGCDDILSAKKHYTECLKLAKKARDKSKKALAMLHLGECAFVQMDYKKASEYLVQSLAVFQKEEFDEGTLKSLEGLAHIAYLRNDFPNVLVRLEECISLAFRMGEIGRSLHALEGYVALYETMQDSVSAACVLGASHSFINQMLKEDLLSEGEYSFHPEHNRSQMKKKTLIDAWNRGLAMDILDIIDFVSRNRERLYPELVVNVYHN